MGRNNFNIEQIKQQIENADNDQLNDQYTEALNKNFEEVDELNKKVEKLNPKVDELVTGVKTCTDAALSAVYTIENHLQVVMSPETKEKVRDACEAIGDGVITSFNTQTKALLKEVEKKGDGIVTKIGTKGSSICTDIDTHAKSLIADMEKTANKIIERMKEEEVRVCIPPAIFMSMLIAIIVMVGMLMAIACFNQQSIHSSNINVIFGWGIAGYAVFIVLLVWFSVRSRD